MANQLAPAAASPPTSRTPSALDSSTAELARRLRAGRRRLTGRRPTVLRLYDTRTRAGRDDRAGAPGELRLYCCGPTVYRYAHVGNLRTFLLADLIRRIGRAATGCRSRWCRTSPTSGTWPTTTRSMPAGEDKMLRAGRRRGARTRWRSPGFYEEAFHADLAALDIRPADAYPRASECIGLMIDLIGTLVEQRARVRRPRRLGVLRRARPSPVTARMSGNRLDATCAPATASEGGRRRGASGSTPTGRCGSGAGGPAS